MGNAAPKDDKGDKRPNQASSKREKGAIKLLGQDSLESLKVDWCTVKGIPYTTNNGRIVPSKDISKTEITPAEFKKLMSTDMREKDLESLFNLYDYDHNGTISWREYVCVIALIMAGNTKEKIRLIFNCFDEDGNGSLSKEEFQIAAGRFSDFGDKNATAAFTDRVFTACDADGDGTVTFKEFEAWVKKNPSDFERFVGVLNILPAETD